MVWCVCLPKHAFQAFMLTINLKYIKNTFRIFLALTMFTSNFKKIGLFCLGLCFELNCLGNYHITAHPYEFIDLCWEVFCFIQFVMFVSGGKFPYVMKLCFSSNRFPVNLNYGIKSDSRDSLEQAPTPVAVSLSPHVNY